MRHRLTMNSPFVSIEGTTNPSGCQTSMGHSTPKRCQNPGRNPTPPATIAAESVSFVPYTPGRNLRTSFASRSTKRPVNRSRARVSAATTPVSRASCPTSRK